LKNFEKDEKTGIISTKFSLRCTPSVILGLPAVIWLYFTRTIYSNRKGQDNFWQQNAFLTCSWRFLRSKKLEQLKSKLEKIIGI